MYDTSLTIALKIEVATHIVQRVKLNQIMNSNDAFNDFIKNQIKY